MCMCMYVCVCILCMCLCGCVRVFVNVRMCVSVCVWVCVCVCVCACMCVCMCCGPRMWCLMSMGLVKCESRSGERVRGIEKSPSSSCPCRGRGHRPHQRPARKRGREGKREGQKQNATEREPSYARAAIAASSAQDTCTAHKHTNEHTHYVTRQPPNQMTQLERVMQKLYCSVEIFLSCKSYIQQLSLALYPYFCHWQVDRTLILRPLAKSAAMEIFWEPRVDKILPHAWPRHARRCALRQGGTLSTSSSDMLANVFTESACRSELNQPKTPFWARNCI